MPPFHFFFQTQGHGDIPNFPSLSPAIPALPPCLLFILVMHLGLFPVPKVYIYSFKIPHNVCLVLWHLHYISSDISTPTLYQFLHYIWALLPLKRGSLPWTDNFMPFVKSFCLTPAFYKTEWKIFMLTLLNLRLFFPYHVLLHALHPSSTSLACPFIVFSHTHQCLTFHLVFVVPFYPSPFLWNTHKHYATLEMLNVLVLHPGC